MGDLDNMSRSTRNSPICGITTARSEKQDKISYHKAFRRATKQQLSLEVDLPHFREFSKPWLWSKDGKQYFGSDNAKLMRK